MNVHGYICFCSVTQSCLTLWSHGLQHDRLPSPSLCPGCPLSRWCLLIHSVQFSRSVVSDSLRPHELQHARPPCPSPTPRVHSNLCPLSRWSHPTISSSVIPFFSCPQPFPASGAFPMSQLFALGDQSIGVSASASVLPMNIHSWSPLGWTILLLTKYHILFKFPFFFFYLMSFFCSRIPYRIPHYM